MHGKVQLRQRAQQALDGVGQHDGAGRVGQQARACDQCADAHRQQDGILDTFDVNVQNPEVHERLPLPRDEEQVQHCRKNHDGHDGLEAFQNHPAGNLRYLVQRGQQQDGQRQSQRVRGHKQHDDIGNRGDQLEPRVTAVQDGMPGKMLTYRNIFKHLPHLPAWRPAPSGSS